MGLNVSLKFALAGALLQSRTSPSSAARVAPRLYPPHGPLSSRFSRFGIPFSFFYQHTCSHKARFRCRIVRHVPVCVHRHRHCHHLWQPADPAVRGLCWSCLAAPAAAPHALRARTCPMPHPATSSSTPLPSPRPRRHANCRPRAPACLRITTLPPGNGCRGYTLASAHRSDTVGQGLDQRMVLLLDNLTVTPSWGITTARERPLHCGRTSRMPAAAPALGCGLPACAPTNQGPALCCHAPVLAPAPACG